MSRVTRVEQKFDQELADKGLCRVCAREWMHDGDVWTYVSREVVITRDEFTQSLTPWWKRSKKKRVRDDIAVS